MAKKHHKISDLRLNIMRHGLALAQEKDWNLVSLQDIARAAKMNLSDLRDVIDDKNDILMIFSRWLDGQVLANIPAYKESETTCRERLFDLLMDRFDLLNDHRAAILSILSSFCQEPGQMMVGMPHIARSMRWMCDGAGIDLSGVRGELKLAGVSVIYISALRVWQKDESPDLSKTMAALDKYLTRAEDFIARF